MTWTRPVPGGVERQDRGADIAAELRVVAGRRGRGARSSAVVVDLPLVPVMATNGASGAMTRALAAEQFDVADHLDAGLLRQLDDPVRRRDGSAARRAPAPAPRSCDQSASRRSAVGMPAASRFRDARRIVVPGDDVGAAGQQRAARSPARAAQAEHGDLFAGKGRDRNHDAATSASGSTGPPARARPRRSRSG